jgi:hypothetical protein
MFMTRKVAFPWSLPHTWRRFVILLLKRFRDPKTRIFKAEWFAGFGDSAAIRQSTALAAALTMRRVAPESTPGNNSVTKLRNISSKRISKRQHIILLKAQNDGEGA